MRLDKFLVACAVGSRTEVKNLLKAGRATVNGKKEKSAKLQIDQKTDEIRFDGQVLEYEEFVYYMMNKPKELSQRLRILSTEPFWTCWMILLGARKFSQ